MTVVSIDTDAAAKSMVITTEFAATVADVWQLWADPRLLESWWGPPELQTTFEQHDLTPGGTITYSIRDADGGEPFEGTWTVVEADAPSRLVVEDAVVDDDGTPSDGNAMTHMEVDIEPLGDGTRMVLTIHFATLEGMQAAMASGVGEGLKASMSQIDALLGDAAA